MSGQRPQGISGTCAPIIEEKETVRGIFMRKTKIICTLGPSTDKDGVLRELVANGMNVARFNFSHGSYEEHKGRLDMLKAVRAELNKPVAALLDTKGPEIRLKEFKNGVEMLEAGQTFTLTTREVEGTKEICSITYKDLPQDVHEGGTIMLDDGLIKLAIKSVTDTDIVCEVLNSGKIKTKKGVNVPGVHLSMPYLSQRDRDDIIFGVQQGFDFIAASFVRTAQDVYDIRNLLNEYDSNIRIIAKIENREVLNSYSFSITSQLVFCPSSHGSIGVSTFLSLTIRSITASAALFPSNKTLFISVMIGISTSYFSASSFAAFAE